jgi:hypothetical protein
MQPLQDIAGPPGLTNPYGDVALLRSHRDQGHDLSGVIYLSLGETWKGPPSGLLAALRDVPAHAHGYQLTPHGVPALREVLRDYITRTHHLAEVSVLGSDFEVAGTAGSTRSAMRDFGRLLLEDQPTASARPIAVCGSPGWDYPGVYTPLGYEMRHFALDVDRGYQPDTAEVKECLSQARQDTTGPVLLIVNAQHNPSGSNWSADVVREMVRAALEFDVHVLVDDAYYAVHDPAVTPTSALRILLEEIASLPSGVRRPRWLATRSMASNSTATAGALEPRSRRPRPLRTCTHGCCPSTHTPRPSPSRRPWRPGSPTRPPTPSSPSSAPRTPSPAPRSPNEYSGICTIRRTRSSPETAARTCSCPCRPRTPSPGSPERPPPTATSDGTASSAPECCWARAI